MSRSLSALGLAVLALLLVCSARAVGAEESPHPLPRSCPEGFAASGPAGGKVACTRQVTVAHVCPPDSVAGPGQTCHHVTRAQVSCPAAFQVGPFTEWSVGAQSHQLLCFHREEPQCDVGFRANAVPGRDNCVAIVAATGQGNIRNNARCPADRSYHEDNVGAADRCTKFFRPIVFVGPGPYGDATIIAHESPNPIPGVCPDGFTFDPEGTRQITLGMRCVRTNTATPVCPAGSTAQAGGGCTRTETQHIECPLNVLEPLAIFRQGEQTFCVHPKDPVCDVGFRNNALPGKDNCVAIVALTPTGNERTNIRCDADRSYYQNYTANLDQCVKYTRPHAAQ